MMSACEILKLRVMPLSNDEDNGFGDDDYGNDSLDDEEGDNTDAQYCPNVFSLLTLESNCRRISLLLLMNLQVLLSRPASQLFLLPHLVLPNFPLLNSQKSHLVPFPPFPTGHWNSLPLCPPPEKSELKEPPLSQLPQHRRELEGSSKRSVRPSLPLTDRVRWRMLLSHQILIAMRRSLLSPRITWPLFPPETISTSTEVLQPS